MAHRYPTRAGILIILGLLLIIIPGVSLYAQINFAQSELDFDGNGDVSSGVTSLMYGPDGRLYIAEYPGTIKILTIQRNSATDYNVTAVESLSFVKDIINYDDDGTPCSGTTNDCTSRETIGLTVTGTSNNPVVYITSSDFRIGAGSGGGNGDVDLDTNSGVITRLSWNGSSWDVVDIVRGLPRSEENHATNGLEIVSIGGVEYLIVASGGITNAGGPSTNFVYTCEYALSGAVLSINLDMLNSMPVQTDGNGRKYIYDLPTLDDPTRPNANGIEDPNNSSYNGVDVNDPWGGNDGLNQAVIVPGGPVQIYSPGYRNAYDLVVTESGALYVTDNGANQGWGGFPVNEGGGSATNAYDPAEPGSNTTSGGEQIDNVDHLELVTTDIQSYVPNSFYAGHPNPVRANPSGAGLYTNFNGTTAFRTQTYDPNGSTPGSTSNANIALPANWPPVPVANQVEGDWRGPTVPNPDGPDDEPVLTWTTNTNGIDEYTASNFGGIMQGDLIAGKNGGILRRVELNSNGTVSNYTASFGSGLGGNPLGITCNSDLNPFPGTIWAGTLNGKIIVLEPADLVECFQPGDPEYDPNADYDSDGYTNQDEADNGTDPCNGGSQPNDFDKSAGGNMVSDLNDLDDDNDGTNDANDPFQLGNPVVGGSDAFTIPILNGLFNDQQGLGGIFGLGMTGLMNNGDPNPNWLNWLDDRGQGPNPDDVLGGAPGLMTSHMTSGTANGSTNTQEKGYQYGVQVDQSTGLFTVSGNLINFDAPLQLYGNTAAIGGELGLFIGDGTQSNFIKFVINTNGLSALQEINDTPGTPINFNIPVANRPQSVVLFYFVVDPSNSLVTLEYSLDNGPRTQLGTITAQGNVLTAIQQSNTDLAVGFIGTSNTAGVELEGTWDFLNVVPGDGTTSYRINAGGPTVNATDNEADWEANNIAGSYTGVTYSVNTGNKYNSNLLFANRHSSIPSYIDASTFNAIFAKERWDSPNGAEMEFTIPLNNGQHTVNLFLGNSFAGTSQVGQRIFDIFIEGILVKDNLDLISEFGHQSGGMLSFNTSVADGELNISFGHVLENPLINAIEVFSNVASGTPIFVSPIADQNSLEGENLNGSLGVVASGGDGNLSYVMSGQPSGVFIEPTNGQIGGTINPGTSTNSPYNVSITVDDSDGETTDAVTINFTWNVSTSTCNWTNLNTPTVPRMEPRAEIVDNKIYSMGGFVLNLTGSDLNEIYQPETNTWSLGTPLPFVNTHMGSAIVGEEIWLIGGFTGDHPGPATDAVVIYNTKTDSWSNGPSLPQPIGSGAATYHNNKIHFFGGLLPDRQTDIGNHYVLDLSNQAAGWTLAAPMPVPRNHHWAETLNGIIYSIGGQTGHDGPKVYLDVVHAYNPNTDSWTQVASLPRKRSHIESGTSVHDNKILVTGGRDINYYFDDLLEYDPVGDSWTNLCDTPDPLLAPIGIAYNNQFVLSGGTIGNILVLTDATRSLPLQPGSTFSPLQINNIADRLDIGGDSVSFTVSGSGGDPFADLSFFIEGQPQGIDIDTRTGQISGTVDLNASAGGPNNDGIYSVVVRMNKPGSVWVQTSFTWTISGNLNWIDKNEDENYTGRHECSFVQAGNKFYLMGGRENSQTLDVYDYATNSWNSLTNSVPVEFNHYQATEYQGLIWVIGAFKTNTFPNESPADFIWAFDPATSEWIQGPAIPAGRKRGSAGLAIYNDKFYIVGGNTIGHSGGYVSWFDEYDPATGIWTSLTDAPRARDHFHAAVIGDKLFAAGGRLSGGTGGVFKPVIPEVDVYDFSTGTWSTLPAGQNIPTPRAAAATVNFNDKLVVIGGEVFDEMVYGVLTDDALEITEEYDPSTGSWTRLADMNFERHGTQAIVSGNGIHILAGSPNRGGGSQKNMEYLGIDSPVGSPSTSSNLSTPASTTIENGTNSAVNLTSSGGNVGTIVTSIDISGPDASDFNIVSGNLNNGLIEANSIHSVTLSYAGSVDNASATLEVNYGVSGQLTVALTGNTSGATSGVVSLTLINADNDTDLFDLTEGLVIDESIVQGINLAIRANTNPTIVGSVFLDLSGPTSNTRNENAEPYALYGNSGSNYNGVPFPSGSYSMSATAYSGSNQGGTNLGSLTVQFDIGTGGSTNNPPIVTNPGTQNNTEGDPVALQIIASDESTNLSYLASGLPPGLIIDPNTGLISGTLPTDTGTNGFVEQSGSVVIDAESGNLVPNWTQTTTGGATGIIAGSNHFSNQNGGTIPYDVTITTPGVYRFNWRSFFSGSVPTDENDNWLRFPNDNDVWFFGIQGTVTDEASVIANLQGAQNNIVFPKGSSRVTAGTTPNGNGSNGYFKVFRSGGTSEVYKWQAVTSDNDGHKIYVWFVNPGTYTFEISERSLGHAIDRVALYKIDTYGDTYSANNFTNVPESPQGGGAALGSPYTVGVTVTDDGVPNLATTEQFMWNVSQGVVNQPPTAIVSANPLSGDAALQVSFTGSNSTDDVAVTSYFWDFKDGNTSPLADPVYTFNTPGTYMVELTVQDAEGLSDTDSITIDVSDPNTNDPPSAVASANPQSGDIPLQVNFTGSNSTDDTGIVSFSWDFGDGGNSNIADPIYTYNGAGNFIATLTVTDGEGLEDTAIVNIDAIDPSQNGVVSFTLINADTDQDLYNLSEGLQIDESTISSTNLAIRANTNPGVVGSVFLQLSGAINASRTENAAAYALFGNSGSNYFGQLFPLGSYTMSATAYSGSNLSGNNLGSLNVQFEVVTNTTPQPPIANAGADQNITLPTNSVVVNGSGSDPDGGSIVSYAWNQQSGPNTATLSGENTANLTASNLIAGTYIFRLTVTDDESDTDFDDMSVTVQNQPTVEVRINSGGPSFSFGGDTWAADQNFSTSNSFTNVVGIGNTSNDQLYQSERYARSTIGSFTYNIPVPIGNYDLNLHFAEIWFGAPGGGSGGAGSRIFNVDIENGQNQLSNYDVIVNAGGSATAVIESFTSVTVNDGSLTLVFNSVVENAKLSGIEIVSASGGSSSKGLVVDNTKEESINQATVQKINIPILSPNPATTEVSISFKPDTNDGIELVNIYDISGRLVLNYNSKDLRSTTGSNVIDISSLADGVYPITIRTNSQAVYQYRLVVEKQ